MLKSSKATRKRVSSSSSHSAADAAAAKSTAKPRHTPPNTATISAKATAADQQQPIMAAQVHPKKRGRPFKQNLVCMHLAHLLPATKYECAFSPNLVARPTHAHSPRSAAMTMTNNNTRTTSDRLHQWRMDRNRPTQRPNRDRRVASNRTSSTATQTQSPTPTTTTTMLCGCAPLLPSHRHHRRRSVRRRRQRHHQQSQMPLQCIHVPCALTRSNATAGSGRT